MVQYQSLDEESDARGLGPRSGVNDSKFLNFRSITKEREGIITEPTP
jgi:hypothetical protein